MTDTTTEQKQDQPLKVAIIGTAPSTRDMAPFDDPSWQIWACSAGNMNQLKRVNCWFEMHAVSEMMAPWNREIAVPLYAYLKEHSDAGHFQVIMLDAGSESGGPITQVPKAIPYPKDAMVAMFGRNWFTSTVAYMMAMAIAKGAKQIGLFGIDMAHDHEHYSVQRAGCTRFIEIAESNGIEVTVPFDSCLKVATPMYGYWEGTPFGRRVIHVRRTLEEQVRVNTVNREAQAAQINYLTGALEQVRYFERTWTDGAEYDPQMGQFLETLQELETAAATAASVDKMMADRPLTPGSSGPLPPSTDSTGPFHIEEPYP